MVFHDQFSETLVRQAIQLASHAWNLQVTQNPSLPAPNLPSEDAFLKLARALPCCAVTDGDDLIGYVCAFSFGDFRGVPVAYSPIWGNGFAPGRESSFHDVYRELSVRWMNQGLRAHLFTTFACNSAVHHQMHWQGFGDSVSEASRPLEPIDSPLVDVRRATPEDAATLASLGNSLIDHLAASPIFLRYPYQSVESWQQTLANPDISVWLATIQGSEVAYLKAQSCTPDLSPAIVATDSLALSGAYCLPEHRHSGVVRTLLNAAVEFAKQHGHSRLVVDWETTNIEGSRFWLRHFTPASLSLLRVVP